MFVLDLAGGPSSDCQNVLLPSAAGLLLEKWAEKPCEYFMSLHRRALVADAFRSGKAQSCIPELVLRLRLPAL